VTRTEHDGSITIIADSFEGKPLNSPNDVIVKSDGSIWFSDPHYGIMTNYEGFKSKQELPCQVYRINPDTKEISAVVADLDCPNGLAFSHDETKLYVADTGKIFDENANRLIRCYAVEGNNVDDGTDFHKVAPGCADGFRLDEDGNVWTSAGDGVHCISPTGKFLGKILVPETVSNICFRGRAKHQLFITATTSLYTITLNRSGIQKP
jgi:gluconolactonase